MCVSTTPTLSLSNLFLSPENRLHSTPTATSSLKFPHLNHFRAAVKAFIVTENLGKTGSFYEILRVKHNAFQNEIKMAYRTLTKLYHPNASFSANSISDGLDFIEIHNAYETLSDSAARALYDMSLGAYYLNLSSSSLSSSFGFYPTQRWETDQCW